MIKGYKGTGKDLKCYGGYQYEQGKDYEQKGTIRCCGNGLHFCENPFDVFGHFPPADSRYFEVEGDGDFHRDPDGNKIAVSKLHIGLEIGLKGITEAGVKFVLDKIDWENAKESNTGYQSAATNTGYQSAATNTGD